MAYEKGLKEKNWVIGSTFSSHESRIETISLRSNFSMQALKPRPKFGGTIVVELESRNNVLA